MCVYENLKFRIKNNSKQESSVYITQTPNIINRNGKVTNEI